MRLFSILISFIPFGLFASSVDDFIKYDQQENNCKCDIKGEDFLDAILLNAIESKSIKDEYFLACTHHCLAVHYYRNQAHFEAIDQYKIAIEIRQKKQDHLLWKSYRNLGYAYKEAGYSRKSMESILQAMELNERFQKDVMANIYISRSYRDLGEYEKAIEYGQIALTLAETNNLQGEAFNNLAIIHEYIQSKESLSLAIQYAQKAIQYYGKARQKFNVAGAYNCLGNTLKLLEEYDQSIDAYNKALKIYSKNDVILYARVLNNIASVLNLQNEYKEAIKLLDESLELKQKYYNNTYHPDCSSNYENLGDNYMGLGKFDKAQQFYEKSINNLKDNPEVENPYIYNKPNYINVLDLKAQAAKMNGDIDLAHQIYQYIDDWITLFYKDLSTKTSKLVWIERAHNIYGNAIEIALMKDDPDRAFRYAEKAHAVLLWQNLSQQAAESLLPEEDREKREDLIAKLRQAERQYQNGSIDISTLRTYEKEQKLFETDLEERHVEYARSKYQTESTTVEQVQGMIDSNTAFIEYYWTDDVLRIFTITKEKLTVHTETANDLDKQIAELRSIISHPKCDTDCAKNAYNPLAFDLYKKLIPSQIQSNTDINRLVIVADKAIGTLPFSALATEASAKIFDTDYPFLLYKYVTNYLYSAGSFLQFQQKNTHNTRGFAGFAPVEYHIADRDFLPLYKTKQEVEEIAGLYPRRQQEIYTETDANKQNFIKALQENYHTILLATHAKYSHSKGEIAFRDGVMSQHEIDQLSQIRTQRLVLSACQTAEGKQNAGEGVLSLGWNFAYKGVPSITMNQWSVSENATMQIMVAYNELLRQNLPADQALQAAQISYLKETGKHQPYYWAAIIHVGNPDSVSTAFYAGHLGEMSWQWVLILLLMAWIGYRAVRQR